MEALGHSSHFFLENTRDFEFHRPCVPVATCSIKSRFCCCKIHIGLFQLHLSLCQIGADICVVCSMASMLGIARL